MQESVVEASRAHCFQSPSHALKSGTAVFFRESDRRRRDDRAVGDDVGFIRTVLGVPPVCNLFEMIRLHKRGWVVSLGGRVGMGRSGIANSREIQNAAPA